MNTPRLLALAAAALLLTADGARAHFLFVRLGPPAEGGRRAEVYFSEYAEAGARSVYDLDYLRANIAAGEGFDWHYASPADREAQVRTEIGDGAAGKPWVFRFKDLRSWWLNQHYDRPGGIVFYYRPERG